MTNPTVEPTCPFCNIMTTDTLGQVIKRYNAKQHNLSVDVIVFIPFQPVVAGGHYLVVPCTHVKDYSESPVVCADVAYVASLAASELFAGADYNVITNRGRDADQTVFHLHTHIIKRNSADMIQMPWSKKHHDMTYY